MRAMFKKILAVSALFAISAVMSGCFAETIRKTVQVDNNYTVLDISTAISVELSDKVRQATISADEKTIDAVVVERIGQMLKVYMKVNWFRANNFSGVTVILPISPVLEELNLSGASSFYSSVPLKSESFEVALSGASNFKGDIDAVSEVVIECSGASDYSGNVISESLDLDFNGASSAKISGKTGKASIELSGASSLKGLAGKLIITEVADFSVSGASDVAVDCRGNISGKVSGASSLRYGGPVRNNSVSNSGASSVRP